MNAKSAGAIGIVGTLTLTLAVAALAQTPGTAFTYQGRLEISGAPANGLHDLRFRAWLHENDPNNPIGPVVCKDNVNISDGLFTTHLDFGSNVFIGFPLWLEIEVRADATPGNCSGGGYQTLSPRQLLSPTPYAVFATAAQTAGLRLPFDGETSSGPAAALLDLENTLATNATSFAGIFRVHSTGGNTRAITGIASGGSGATYGVYGQNNSTAGVGVHGESFGIAGMRGVANNTSGINYGVYGESLSPDGYGGYFVGARSYFSGEVGIGTLNPNQARLHVEASDFAIFGRSSSTVLGVGVHGSGRTGVQGQANHPDGFGGVFRGSGSLGAGNALRVAGIARVAEQLNIGGTDLSATPATKLQIENGDDASLATHGFAVLGPTTAPNLCLDENEILARNNGAASSLFLNHNGGDVLVNAAGGGRLGVGTSAPQQRLDVAGNVRLTGGLYFSNSVVNPDGWSDNVLSFGDPGEGEDYMVYAQGEFFFQDSPGGGDTSSPSLYAGDFITNSDIRLKKDIEPLTNALNTVRQLNGLRYRFDGTKVDPAGDPAQEDPRLHIGFSAQAVAEVVPEVVHYSATFDKFGISYGGLAPLLVEAIKEQQALIDEQRATINAQQAMIDAIRAEIRELQARRAE